MAEDILVLFFICASLSWIAWIIVSATVRLHVSRKQAALQSRLLDVLSSGHDLAGYMSSDAGRELVQSLATAPERPHARILNTLQVALVLVFSGASLLVARMFVAGDGTPLVAAGVVIAGLGLGFAAAAAAAYTVSKRLGLLQAG